MCLIAFSYKSHSKYKLILAANRDEFYERPTREATFWENEDLDHVLAGKDLKANGTWMGLSKRGKWGALTNFRDLSNIKEDAPTRGKLVLDYLKTETDAESYLLNLKKEAKNYNGFNVLLAERERLFHYSNETDSIQELEAGIHGVSNAVLNTSWPKLDTAKRELQSIIKNNSFDKEELFQLLKNPEKAPDEALPSTGIPYEWEKAISSIFIHTENYGTLCSSILLIDYDGNVEFTERRFGHSSGNIIDENTF